jgi:YHS domain-containing protein
MTVLSRRSVLALALLVACPLHAQNSKPRPEKRVVIGGYDPVAYFTEGRPARGMPEFTADFDDMTYWFASVKHRDMFLSDPDHYAPQFGGLCTVSLSMGQLAEPDPEAWAIADGKLYLFSTKAVVGYFQQQTASIVGRAAEVWPDLHKSQ